MAQFLVSVVCLAVLPTVQSKQVLSLGKDDRLHDCTDT